MFNRKRTLEKFGYDLDLSVKRRTQAEIDATNGKNKKNLLVVDNCPECGNERDIQLRASKKNVPCPKCFHNSPDMIKAKQNQNKEKSPETRQKMSDNHWSTKGIDPWNKDLTGIYSPETIQKMRDGRERQFSQYSEEEIKQQNIKGSCTQQGIPIEEFKGFITPENTAIRQSPEGKVWVLDVLQKANFTCDKCSVRGGSLQAHHLNAFSSYPNERFDPENGVCLCSDCHKEFHTSYGKGDNTKEQYKEFIGQNIIK